MKKILDDNKNIRKTITIIVDYTEKTIGLKWKKNGNYYGLIIT